MFSSYTKTDGGSGRVDWAVLRKIGVLPLHKACHNKMVATPLSGFVASSRCLLQEEGGLPKARTSDGFDPNVYKLMKRSGYDFSKPPLLGSVIEASRYGFNDTQKMIQKQGGGFITLLIGLGYVPSQPVKISDDANMSSLLYNTSRRKKLIMRVVTRLHPVQRHRYLTAYNRLCHNDALLCSIG